MKRLLEDVVRRTTLLVAMLLVAIVPAGTLTASAGAAGHATKHAKHGKHGKHGKKHKKAGGCHIPQGNVKDNDPDNHGGPNDGDGCM